MSLFSDDSSAVTGALEAAEDLRFNARAKFRKKITVSPLGSSVSYTVTLIDLSRDGLYFTSRSHRFEIGAKLGVSLPNSSECVCEVVRTEELPGAAVGVGLRIVSW